MEYQIGLPQARCTVSEESDGQTKKAVVKMEWSVYRRCVYSMLGLTIWMLIPWWGLSIEASEWRKGNMTGSESCPQLISILIFTFLSKAAVLRASSMSGQYLLSETIQREDMKQIKRATYMEIDRFLLWFRFTSLGFQNVWWGSTPWRLHRQSVEPLRCWRE